jgi:MFS family permease
MQPLNPRGPVKGSEESPAQTEEEASRLRVSAVDVDNEASRMGNLHVQTSDDRYTVFSTQEKRLIVFLVSLAGVFSAFTAFVYFPALPSIASTISVSMELMNITVTAYLVVQGIAPSILDEISDTQGRRIVYLAVFAIYCAASIGLAYQNSYGALLVLRMLQSAGASGTVALAYGVIADIAPPHERGGYVGTAHVGWYAAPSLGPVIGGILAQYAGWRWIFRFLAILSGVVLGLFVLLLPETSRKVVGNGGLRSIGISQSIVILRKQRKASDLFQEPARRGKSTIPNPLRCLKMILHKNTSLLLAANAIFYLQYSCVQASLAPLLQKLYGLSTLQSGLCYLTYGVPGSIASYVVGRIANYDYRVTAKSHNIFIDIKRGDNILEFPIEKARLRTIWVYIILASGATIGYGWALDTTTHLAVPLITQVLTGLTVTGIFNATNTLIVDLYADEAMTASAAVSITRCFVAAGGVSVLQPLFNSIGVGWTFTIIGIMCYSTIPMLWVLHHWGWAWRREKAQGRVASTSR